MSSSREAPVAPLLQIVKGSKVYGGIHAIDGVDFELRAGEIHAVLGENGAGKSTLCKAIAGAIKLTSGDYFWAATQGFVFNSPQRGAERRRRHGLSGDQSRSLDDRRAEPRTRHGEVLHRLRKINIAAQQSQQAMNFNVDPLALVETLGTAKRQMVEIVRAVRHNAQVFIFDEPTA